MSKYIIISGAITPENATSAILNLYDKDLLSEAYHSFEWQNANFQDAIYKRNVLEKKLMAAILNNDDIQIDACLTEIYYWGFKRYRPNTKTDNWKNLACDLVKKITNDSNLEKEKSLIKILDEKGIGIATASKWICFCDQTQFAIYDSRVSLALRTIVDEKNNRIFPTIARRSTKIKKYPAGDVVDINIMAKKYFFYIKTLREIEKTTNLTPSQIEMALFMIGK